jgi:membrane associated rhomboid family serine protease
MKLSSFPFSKQHSLIVLIIAVISIFAFAAEFFINDSVTQVFVYHRNLIAQGEIWRLFTGHLLHTNGYHLLLNLAALVMLWALHGRFYTNKNYCALFTFCDANFTFRSGF